MSFLECVFGPRLYVDYKNQLEKSYNPGPLEKLGDQIISTVSILYNVGYYASPILGTFVYRRGYLTNDSGYTLLKFGASIVTILVISLCLRGVGRLKSPTYVRFIKALSVSKKTKCSNSTLSYDFDFREWNVDFDMSSTLSAKLTFENDMQIEKSANSSVPCKLLAYVSMHTFGLSMIYPGSVKLLQKYMRPMLLSGRASLIKNFHARRYKLKTIDKNEIDSCFVDNREKKGNGEILVICSEGNAGFYEIGIMSTPLSHNYSVLGWNHPGFAGSTGKPVPDQERNAIYCIMTFAINHLGFTENNILLYGWSIGAYTTLYAASSFENIKGVILDATFDDILYLARNRMPESLAPIVSTAIRSYCNLNNLDLITRVNAPILLIRRTEDEIIAEENCINSNRGNFLAMHLLTHRYPNIFKGAQLERIRTILSKPIEENEKSGVSENCLLKTLKSMKHQNGNSFPLLFGGDLKEESRTEIAEFLLYKHLLDFASTHCTPLPAEYFNIPWDLSNID